MKLICQLQYHGGFTAGWQEQPHESSIASHLKQAIHSFTGQQVDLACAGRTDKGVHAVGQVISFDTQVQRTLVKWKTGLNHFLPEFIRVQSVIHGPDAFHPRFNACARTYRYYCVVRRSPHLAGIISVLNKHPDLQRLNQACQLIIGTHDFSSFRGGSCQAKSPVKTCYTASWRQQGDLFCFEIKASAFLHHMVRYLVGCMLQVGYGHYSLQWFEHLVQGVGSQDFCADGAGLYFCHASYPEQYGVPFVDQRPWFDQ